MRVKAAAHERARSRKTIGRDDWPEMAMNLAVFVTAGAPKGTRARSTLDGRAGAGVADAQNFPEIVLASPVRMRQRGCVRRGSSLLERDFSNGASRRKPARVSYYTLAGFSLPDVL